MRYTKLRDWINVISLLYAKTLKQSVIYKNNDEREGNDLKKIYDHHLDKRNEIMNNTQFKVEVVIGDKISKDSISPKQLTKLNIF